MLEGEIEMVLAWPVPVSAALVLTLPVIETAPVRVPLTVFVNVTLIEQLAPTAREVPHVEVSAKSPVTEILEMETGRSPVLLYVRVCAGLVVPMRSGANVRAAGERV